MPKLYIIAGPNGAGKTTFAKEFLPHYAKCSFFINADLIAQGLSPFSPTSVRLKAGRLLLEEISQLSYKQLDFAFESTLAGKTYLSLLQNIQDKGYSIHIFFLWIPSVALAEERIKQRVKEGGHNVPVDDIRRRFQRSLVNFVESYRALCATWIIFDNSTGRPIPIVINNGAELIIYKKEIVRKYFSRILE